MSDDGVTQEWVDEQKFDVMLRSQIWPWFADCDRMEWFEDYRRRSASRTRIWTPSESLHLPATWLRTAPGCLLMAADLLRAGKGLHEMPCWRDFEELVAYLLEQDGWTVDLTKPSREGGVDVFAVKSDLELGRIQTI